MIDKDPIQPVAPNSREIERSDAVARTSEAKESIKEASLKKEEHAELNARKGELVHFSRETAGDPGAPPPEKSAELKDRLSWLQAGEPVKGAAKTAAAPTASATSSLGGFLEDVVDKGRDLGGDLIEGAGDKGSGLIDGIKERGCDIFGGVKDIGGDILDGVKERGGDILDGVRDRGGDILDGVRDRGGDALKGLKDLGGDGIEGIKNVFKDIGDSIDVAHNFIDTARDLASKKNNELTPRGDAKPPHELDKDGTLNVVSWNLHKGEGPNDKGQPEQFDKIIKEMRKAGGDVYNLQEVSPDQAQKIADEMGMKAYFTRTTPKQGNMMLLNPDLKVESNEKTTINGDITPGDTASAVKQLGRYMIGSAKGDEEGQKNEPRVAQVLRVKTPDGKTATLWNTHLTGIKDDGWREGQVEKIGDYIDSHSPPGEPVIGGGDLNSRKDSSAIEEFKKQGFSVDGAEIDWIGSRNTQAPPHLIRNNALYDEGGTQISDHPMVIAEVKL
jgi:endonuclease/exonuclease/phosphatase family metal-dependent hydrolase